MHPPCCVIRHVVRACCSGSLRGTSAGVGESPATTDDKEGAAAAAGEERAERRASTDEGRPGRDPYREG